MPRQRRNCVQRVSDWVTRKLTVTGKELLNTADVGIEKQRKMKIYSLSNLICFLIQLVVFVSIQYNSSGQTIKLWHWKSI